MQAAGNVERKHLKTIPLVSVIVPTRNSAQTLHACLNSIVRQSYSKVEIVVVDNNSTDSTREIARAFTSSVYTHGPERSAQRNMGARLARGTYLVFIDSDMILDSAVIEQCIQVSRSNKSAKGIIVPESSTGDGFWARCKALERSCYVGDNSIEAARFFDRVTFEIIGGYDERLTGPEDWDFSQRVAQIGSISRIEAYITHLEGNLTLWETMRTKFYYGKTMGRYMRKAPGTAARQLQLVRPAFIRHWRRLLAHPGLALGMILMKGCEFAAGGTGLTLSSWQQRSSRDRSIA